MPYKVILEGNGRRVLFWYPEGVESPDDNLDCPNMDKVARKKLTRVCKTFIDTGKFPRNDTKFKAVTGYSPLCEIKPDKQLRLLGYHHTLKVFVTVLCVRKKKNKHKPSDLDTALWLVGEHKKSKK